MPDPLAFLAAFEDACTGRRVAFDHGVGLFRDELPRVYYLNFLRVERPGPADELRAAADRLMDGLHHRRLALGDGTPAELERELCSLGWEASHELVMELEGTEGLGAGAEAAEIFLDELEPAEDETRRGYGHRDDEREQLRLAHRVVVDAVPTRHFGVRVDGKLVSTCHLYLGDDIAQIESVGTHPGHRNRGHARAVVSAAARAAGDRHVFLVADADDWPRHLYERMGFRATARLAHFLRRVEG